MVLQIHGNVIFYCRLARGVFRVNSDPVGILEKVAYVTKDSIYPHNNFHQSKKTSL